MSPSADRTSQRPRSIELVPLPIAAPAADAPAADGAEAAGRDAATAHGGGAAGPDGRAERALRQASDRASTPVPPPPPGADAEGALAAGRRALDRGRWQEAHRAFDRAMAADPGVAVTAGRAWEDAARESDRFTVAQQRRCRRAAIACYRRADAPTLPPADRAMLASREAGLRYKLDEQDWPFRGALDLRQGLSRLEEVLAGQPENAALRFERLALRARAVDPHLHGHALARIGLPRAEILRAGAIVDAAWLLAHHAADAGRADGGHEDSQSPSAAALNEATFLFAQQAAGARTRTATTGVLLRALRATGDLVATHEALGLLQALAVAHPWSHDQVAARLADAVTCRAPDLRGIETISTCIAHLAQNPRAAPAAARLFAETAFHVTGHAQREQQLLESAIHLVDAVACDPLGAGPTAIMGALTKVGEVVIQSADKEVQATGIAALAEAARLMPPPQATWFSGCGLARPSTLDDAHPAHDTAADDAARARQKVARKAVWILNHVSVQAARAPGAPAVPSDDFRRVRVDAVLRDVAGGGYETLAVMEARRLLGQRMVALPPV